jgi:WD40 repeat protein/cytochrome c551/c552
MSSTTTSLPPRPPRRRRYQIIAITLAMIQAASAQDGVSFQDDVRPIFESACTSCHNPDKKKGGLDLSSYAAMMAGGSSGEIVIAGDAAGSRLYGCITKTAEPVMPPQGDGLNAAQLEIIKRWIETGLLDTRGGVARKAKKPAFSAQLDAAPTGRPEGAPPMPEHLRLEPVVATRRAAATAALASSPWAPLVALSGQHQVLLYNTDSLELVGVLPVPGGGAVESLAFSRNGRLVIAGTGIGGQSGQVMAWDVTTGRRVFEVGAERDTVLAADLSADQSTIALGGPSRRIKMYATDSGELIKDIKKHTDWVTSLQFSPDGVLLATGDRAGGLHVWEGKSGNEYFTLPGHTAAITAVTWRADGNILASASEDGTVRLWEMNEGKEVKKWTAHTSGVQSLHFAHDGRLVSCGRDRHVKVWNQEGAETASQKSFSDVTLAACFSHDGARFIVGDWSGRISVWLTADAAPAGDLAAAPPTIAQRLAAITPATTAAREQAAAAAATMNAMEAQAATAAAEKEKAQQEINALQTRSSQLQSLAAHTRTAAEAVLSLLSKSPPPDSPAAAATAPQPNEGTTPASDAVHTLDPYPESIAQLSQSWSQSLPTRFATAASQLATSEIAVTTAQKNTAAARQQLEAATTTLAQQEQLLARWQAAEINTQLIAKKELLVTLTAKQEELAATIASTETNNQAPPPELNTLKTALSSMENEIHLTQLAIDSESARYQAQLTHQAAKPPL